MPAPDPKPHPKPPAPAKPGKDPRRTAAFRGTAREIVRKDGHDREAGLSVDAAGAIARALERAYARGHRDARAAAPAPPPEGGGPGAPDATGPVEWVPIPPRPRAASWTICLSSLGRDGAPGPDASGHLRAVDTPDGRSAWRFVTRTGGGDKPFGHATVVALVRLGLLDPVRQPDLRLVVGELGRATWRRFLERGGRRPDDPTSPER